MWMLRINTRDAGTSLRSRRVASMPSISGIEMSAMIKSGRWACAASRSARPSITAPTILKSRLRTPLRPSKNIGWSSASNTLGRESHKVSSFQPFQPNL